jgi:DNA-binding NarL/FixJ family response regulator
MKKYLIFRPGYPGFIWAEITADGRTDNVIVHNIIQSMKRGVYTQKGYDTLCVPNTRNRYGSLTAKKAIAAANRYKGKVNWEKERDRIGELIGRGKSVSEVARMLGVSPSTLSKANKRHQLYPPKPTPCK